MPLLHFVVYRFSVAWLGGDDMIEYLRSTLDILKLGADVYVYLLALGVICCLQVIIIGLFKGVFGK